jgi:hypothetical protein
VNWQVSNTAVAQSPVKSAAAPVANAQAAPAVSAFAAMVAEIVHTAGGDHSPVHIPQPSKAKTPIPAPDEAPASDAVADAPVSNPVAEFQKAVQDITGSVETPAVPAKQQPAPPPAEVATAPQVQAVPVPLLNPVPLAHGTTRTARAGMALKTDEKLPVFAAVVLPFMLSDKSPKLKPVVAEAPPVAAAQSTAPEPTANLSTPAAVEIKLHFADQEQAPDVPAASLKATAADKTSLPLPSEIVSQPVVVAHAEVTPAVPPQVAVHAPAPVPPHSASAPPAAPSAKPTAHPEEVDLPEPKQQAVKSLAIEFAPDGSRDIRVRVAERAGDVHISLHSNDASLSGRLNDGVRDLVDSLSTAGYDAQAWTPDQQRQQQRQDEQPRRSNRNGGDASPDGEFNSLLQQPIKEIS